MFQSICPLTDFTIKDKVAKQQLTKILMGGGGRFDYSVLR